MPNSKEVKLKEDLKKILDNIQQLNRHINESSEDIEEHGEDVDEIKGDVENIKKEIDETGEHVEDIKEDVEEIRKEIDETGEDVEDIKEDIEDIKEHIGALRKAVVKGKDVMAKVATKVLPDKFAAKDIAQQIVGATILSAPFVVTEEVRNLAKNLDLGHIIALIAITLTFDILLFYHAKFQNIEGKRVFNIPLRLLSIIVVTYTTSFLMLTVLGVIGGKVTEQIWAAKLVVLVGLFANVGAGTADLIR